MVHLLQHEEAASSLVQFGLNSTASLLGKEGPYYVLPLVKAPGGLSNGLAVMQAFLQFMGIISPPCFEEVVCVCVCVCVCV